MIDQFFARGIIANFEAEVNPFEILFGNFFHPACSTLQQTVYLPVKIRRFAKRSSSGAKTLTAPGYPGAVRAITSEKAFRLIPGGGTTPSLPLFLPLLAGRKSPLQPFRQSGTVFLRLAFLYDGPML
ncbi:hypothetical protein [Victivallis sp. Marseille-Q1083]|uniref:hypothetical protein n=1 Tax=Victivallis sp. Marseille-Q1083 TaxID=2717288 RepID=UPI00158C2F61|nr:hypothetical protein [Victivallis sp. Marseille-Q1083]